MQRLLVTCATALLFTGVLALPMQDAQSAAGGRGERERTSPRQEDPDHGGRRCTVCQAAERLGIQLTPAYGIVRFRCCDEPTFAMRWPGGRMRPEDLVSLPMELTATFDTEAFERAEVSILAGEHLLHAESTTYSDTAWWEMTSPYRLHRKAHEALRGVRSQLTFSFRFDGYGPELRRPFWLEKPEPALQVRLRDLREAMEDERLASEAPWLQTLMEAQVYWDAGFDCAGEKLARRVLRQHPNEPHALGIQYAVYRTQRFEFTCQGQSAGVALEQALKQRADDGVACHLRGEYDPVAGRAYTRPRAGCGPQRGVWRSR
jgi:hypothetical protein